MIYQFERKMCQKKRKVCKLPTSIRVFSKKYFGVHERSVVKNPFSTYVWSKLDSFFATFYGKLKNCANFKTNIRLVSVLQGKCGVFAKLILATLTKADRKKSTRNLESKKISLASKIVFAKILSCMCVSVHIVNKTRKEASQLLLFRTISHLSYSYETAPSVDGKYK